MTEGQRYLNLTEAGQLVGIGAAAIKYWIIQGLLPAKQEKGRWLITEADVLAANEKNLQNPRRGKRGTRGRLIRAEA